MFQKKDYNLRAKGMFCSGIGFQEICFVHVRNGIFQTISADRHCFSSHKLIDLSTLSLAPLFCDHHLHFPADARASALTIAEALLSSGIGKAYDGGDKGASAFAFKELLKGRPEIMTAGYALYKRGGYGTAIGQGVQDAEEACGKIEELLALSVDYIKIIHSGIYDPESDQITAGGFDADELERIVDYARMRGLAVYCHANGDKAVHEAVNAGVSVVIHGLRVGVSTLSAMAANNVAFIPTVHAFQSLRPFTRTEVGRLNLQKAVERHLSAVSMAYELGVRILPGSDAGPSFLPYGSSYLAELGLLLKAGISYHDIIRAAAVAELKVNTPADYLVLDNLSIIQVVIGGQVVA